MDLIEQAVFTSAETARACGYQVVAASPGIAEADRRALAAWGPSEDALRDPSPGARSINFHPLPSGSHAISVTTAAGQEYSGRGGKRFYTQCFAVPPAILARFVGNPFAVLAAIGASGWLRTDEPLAGRLEPFPVVGRASAVDTLLLSDLCLDPGPARMASVVQAALESPAVALAGPLPAEQAIAGLINCLPPPCRAACSFSTALRFSSRWPYRVIALGSNPDERRRVKRSCRVAVLELTQSPSEPPPLDHPWARLVYQVLAGRRISYFASQMSRLLSASPATSAASLAAAILEGMETPSRAGSR
jgi:hypothetical protein